MVQHKTLISMPSAAAEAATALQPWNAPRARHVPCQRQKVCTNLDHAKGQAGNSNQMSPKGFKRIVVWFFQFPKSGRRRGKNQELVMPPQALALFQVIFQLLDKLCCCALLLCRCCTLLLLCLEKNDSSVLKAHTFFRGVIKNTKSLTLTSSFVKTFRVFKKTLSMESCCYFFVISSVDELIDVIEGNRKYLRCLYVVNKIDNVSMLEMDRLARQPDTIVCSIKMGWGKDYLLAQIWFYLNFIRVFTKKRGERPSFQEPLIMMQNSSIETVCRGVHRDMVKRFKYALVWGTSAKHQPQRVGISHALEDEDVVQLMVHK